MRWIAAHTWLLFLLPIIALLLLSNHTGKPFNLFRNTQIDYIGCDTTIAMHIVGEEQYRKKTIRYLAKFDDNKKVLLYLQKDSLDMPHMGDILLVQTTVERGSKLGDFDYGLYLQRQGIVGTAWAPRRNWQIIGHKENTDIRSIAQRCQYRLHQLYHEMGIRGKELGILSALTLGYREDLDKDVQRAFSASGAMHVLAVSGLHTGIVWAIIAWLLTLGGWCKPLYQEKQKRWILSSIIICLLWGYAFITGLSPSIMRSALMLTFLEFSYLLNHPTSRWNPLLAAAVIILLINPLALWSVSFQLSFAAVASIMLIGTKLQQKVVIRGRFWKYIAGLLIISIAAQIGTMPLTLYYFGQTSNYFALTNLIVIPLAGVLLSLGFCTLALSWCPLGEWLATLTKWCTWLMRQAVEWIERLPYSTTEIHISVWSLIGLYGAFICGIMMIRGQKVHWWWLLGVLACIVLIFKFEVYAYI